MNLHFRRAVFYLILICFVILAPLIIFYTAGYRYNFKQKRISKTGAVLVSSDPASASIFLNERQRQEITPARLFNLTPGEYNLRVVKASYYPWEKKISVKSGEVTFASNLTLFKQSDSEAIASGQVISFILDHQEKNLFYFKKTEDNLYEFWRHDETQGETLIWRGSFSETPHLLSWIGKNDNLLLIKGKDFYLLDLRASQPSLKNLTDLTQKKWDKMEASSVYELIFGQSGQNLYSVNPSNGTADLLASKIIDFYAPNSKIFYLEQDGKGGILMSSERFGEKEIARFTHPKYAFLPSPLPWLILKDGDKNNLTVFLENTPDKQYTADGNSACWYAGQDPSFLSYSNFEVWQNFPLTNERTLVSRTSDKIENIFCHPSNSAFLTNAANELKIIELDTRDKQNIISLTDQEQINQIILDKKGENIYFSGTKNQSPGLWKIQIR